jgi:outer membrane receptor protein involved in Fe transport
MNFLQYPNRKKDKIYFHYDLGRGKGERPSTGIFIYAKPKDQIQKNHNKEALALLEVKKSQLTIDEIISVKLDDGSFVNQNAGKTLHRGIEFGINGILLKDITIRVSGAYSKHEFVDYIEKGVSYNNNEMNNAPNWLYNAEIWYKPHFVKGLRVGAEWQHVGSYFVDPQNSAKYAGYNVLNVRTGYQFKGVEIWLNILNATDNYYSYITSKSSFGTVTR